MAVTDDVKELQAQTTAHRAEFAEFKSHAEVELKDVRDLVRQLGWLPRVLQFALAFATSLLLVLLPFVVWGVYGTGEVKSQVKELDRRAGEVERRMTEVERQLGEIKVLMAEQRVEAKAAAAAADQNTKAILETLKRIEANQKKGP